MFLKNLLASKVLLNSLLLCSSRLTATPLDHLKIGGGAVVEKSSHKLLIKINDNIQLRWLVNDINAD